MTDTNTPTNKRIAAADKLMRLSLDLNEHRGDAATSLMTAAATILHRDFGPDVALGIMQACIEDSRRAWEAYQATPTSDAKH